MQPKRTRSTPPHFHGPTREAASYSGTHLANKGCICRFPGGRPPPSGGSALPPRPRAAPEVQDCGPRFAQSRGRARWASGPRGVPQEDCGATGGMRAGTAGAVRRPPQPGCLSFGLCGGGGSPTSSAKHCAKLGRGKERQTRRSAGPPPLPRAHPQPGQYWTPRCYRLSAGRAPTAGEGDYARALARSPPRCSRLVPRRVP